MAIFLRFVRQFALNSIENKKAKRSHPLVDGWPALSSFCTS